MMPFLLVATGSALGGMARYAVGIAAIRLLGIGFPWGTLAVNVSGSFVIAFFGTLTLAQGLYPVSPAMRLFVMVGFCGGFTTFSSFSLQTFELMQGGARLAALANIALSVILCILAVAAGYWLACRMCGAVRLED